MRPSSSTSEGLFSGILGRGGAAVEVSDAAWLRALLDVEAALAQACAAVGLVPQEAADSVAAACADQDAYEIGALGRDAVASDNPVVPLVRAVERRAGPEHGRFVHHGATSQDVLDTAAVLVATRACAPLLADLRAAADAAAVLTAAHRDTAVAGRTLLQQAVPTTFGLKAAGWALALDDAAEQVAAAVAALPVQVGGAVASGRSLADELAADPACPLDAPALARATSPGAGCAGALVDRALAARPRPQEP